MNGMAQGTQNHDAEDRHDAPGPRVLIAVDDTPGAAGTLRSGLAQAAAQGADVTVLHVVPPRRWRLGRFAPARAVPMHVVDPLESPVLQEARRVAREYRIRPRFELIAADDADTVILGMARRVGAATIVVGGSRPERRVAPLGVCQGVLRRAAVPVFVVPR
jgi:nucleotide-binding universal stress UspA family protein